MIRARSRLVVRAGVASLLGGATGALTAVALMPLLGDGSAFAVRTPLLVGGLAIAGSAAGTSWWAARQARRLRAAVSLADSALSRRAIPRDATGTATESDAVVAAVRSLVEHAERSSRELSQRQAYAAVGDFASELARALSPSVSAARSAIRTLEGHLHPDSPFRAPLERAQRELHRLANTLQDTLRLARSGRLTARRLDLWVPLRSALRTVGTDARERNVALKPPAFGSAPVWINGDQDALEQLFLNLLLNAVQATDGGGRVEVAVGLGADAEVTITDTGSGIPEGALDQVFEPFYSTRAERAGLGLAIAWRTAAAHGGRLVIESALGRGTTVRVALPRSDSGGEFSLGA